MKIALALLAVFVVSFVAGYNSDERTNIIPVVDQQLCLGDTLFIKVRDHVYRVPKAWSGCSNFHPTYPTPPEHHPV